MEEDNLLEEAIRIARIEGKIRVTILQLKLKLGYNRAGKIMKQIEDRGLLIDGKKGEYWYDRTIA
jgi:S-DNA-T family DNA segregation ATPase FtsK/SpoIIIE